MSEQYVYLASGSPRRRALLMQIGVRFQLLGVTVDEAVGVGEAAASYVGRLAQAKAAAGLAARPPASAAPVLAADTSVVVDGTILGKPVDEEDCACMLARLSGRSHQVFTAIVLATADGSQSRLSCSEVTFRVISPAEAHAYWATGEPRDKAGSYAIQGLAALFVSNLQGSYSGVMGLPLYETALLLQQAGVRCWAGETQHERAAHRNR